MLIPSTPEQDGRTGQLLVKPPAAPKGEPVRPTPPVVEAAVAPNSLERRQLEHAIDPRPPQPSHRRLRVYAYDPSLGTRLETLGINEATLEVAWEPDLLPGPVGEYVEVVDVDPASRCCYAPADLQHPHLLVQDGLRPSESNPQFQQQMAYAVSMKTISHFERALGRAALWAPRTWRDTAGEWHDDYVQRMRIHPHAFRGANAFYSPEHEALLFGYFTGTPTESSSAMPGGLVFTALSSDIIAHETTHALLDGLHRRFREPTNPDVLAFHEAFADVVALFQHFSMPEALRQQIASGRGEFETDSLLAQLAVQFGQATGIYGGLRNAIGTLDPGGRWLPASPTRTDYERATEAHERGSVLVAAVFDAFLQIYRTRSADLFRLASGGTGILQPGAIPTDLVERLAQEAAKAARHVLEICIRALDYVPPVDITFGEYLRALITADRDLVPEDQRAYRVAFVSSFAARGIYPADVKTLSVDSLTWEGSPEPIDSISAILDQLALDWGLDANRERSYRASRANAIRVHKWLQDPRQITNSQFQSLGLRRSPGAIRIGDVAGSLHPMEVHSVRPARRVAPDGQLLSDVVIEITQAFRPDDATIRPFRGGCTLLIDRRTRQIRYVVRKRVDNVRRFIAEQSFSISREAQLWANYQSEDAPGREPFALLHRGY
jgi:hypothetical protein